MSDPLYIIDSDVLISAKNKYYSFNICPGFWDSLIHHHHSGAVFSLDKIRQELLNGYPDDPIVNWVKKDVPVSFFLDSQDIEVINTYREIMLWVYRNPQFTDAAKAKFATEADGWLTAYAYTYGGIVVTNEQLSDDVKRRVPLPNVCREFDVEYCDTFELLEKISVRYEFAALPD